MTTDTIRLRSEFINTKVIANNTARQLGIVKSLLVDIDRREVVALGLRDNILSVAGMPRYMYLNMIEKTGDVILVPDEDVIEDVDVEAYSKLINCEVITEAGELLGRVRDFQFSLEDGKISSLIIASIGLPQIPEQVLSTYELPVEEIVSSGPNRIIVFEGAEERLVQVTVGFLERLGIGRPPWERDEEDPYYTPTARPENQLPTGIPINPPVSNKPIEARPAAYEPAWDEDEWQDAQPRSLPRRQAEAVRYQDVPEPEYEESNWGDTPSYQQRAYVEPEPDYDHDVEADIWDDSREEEPYKPARVNIPERTRTPEYEDG
ncbi:PRC-barrel domain-containing protein [Spirulina subsalsa]|uniref:PRC-barrel domain-containing protein n=1 Tax=Spirulina subsalsa TaxID=54311 RepID=UPI000309E1C1|nr:PRC-barrel domain-containing protein [Spirulina subsalsa]